MARSGVSRYNGGGSPEGQGEARGVLVVGTARARPAGGSWYVGLQVGPDDPTYVVGECGLVVHNTPICQILDGTRFEVGRGRHPPAHMNCRSIRVPIIDGEVIGLRPERPFTERQIVREFSRERGLGTLSERAQLPRGTRGDYDAFRRRRIRDLTGRVPARVTYREWLARQSAEFQDDVLGETRGALFRRGGLSIDRFVDRRDALVPLRELARREAAAFRAAGLDPERFL